MRSVELFTGAGGLALGLDRAGFKPVFMVDWDDHARETIRANAGDGGPTSTWPFHHGDIRDVSFRNFGEIDLLAGGPPCQPFSIAGKHRGQDDARDMWPEAIRAVREICPKAFLFENVRGLARAAFANYLRYIVERLRHPTILPKPGEAWEDHLNRLISVPDEDGVGPTYRVQVHKINAADYGAAQKRHRVVISGIRLDISTEWEFLEATHSRDALVWDQYVTGSYWRRHEVQVKSRPSPSDTDSRVATRLDDGFKAPNTKPWVTIRDVISDLPEPEGVDDFRLKNHKFQAGARRYVGHTGSLLDQPAKALKAGDHGVPGGENMLVREDNSVRYFTVRESARLQGFPDNFVFPGSWTETMRQLGNAVPMPVADAIATSLAKALKNSKFQAKSRRAA